jgi:hypothetical protein
MRNVMTSHGTPRADGSVNRMCTGVERRNCTSSCSLQCRQQVSTHDSILHTTTDSLSSGFNNTNIPGVWTYGMRTASTSAIQRRDEVLQVKFRNVFNCFVQTEEKKLNYSLASDERITHKIIRKVKFKVVLLHVDHLLSNDSVNNVRC